MQPIGGQGPNANTRQTAHVDGRLVVGGDGGDGGGVDDNVGVYVVYLVHTSFIEYVDPN